MLWIISGPSSVGKSEFMANSCEFIHGFPYKAPIVRATQPHLLDELEQADLLYHYNILRPLHLKDRARSQRVTKRQSIVPSDTGFQQDPSWSRLVSLDRAKKAIVLVASKQTIVQRVRLRQTVETAANVSSQSNDYPSHYWSKLYAEVDLLAVYQAWLRELRTHEIPYILIDSNTRDYSVIESEDLLPSIVNGVDSNYTRTEIEETLRERKFGYHRVDLPFGLHTPGADRSETLDLIFPGSLQERTVLDVGAALGYFSFEAEARGARKVVGVEIRERRYQDATLLKAIKGSSVDFLCRDIFLDPLEERFDYILLLNVIHHLKEPFQAIRQLAQITRERLIIEFPNFADPKFKNTAGIEDDSLFNRLPLVGVSSMPEADQTFVFTSEAIRRTLLDHEQLFTEVEILDSPIPGRQIAICYSKDSTSTGTPSEELEA